MDNCAEVEENILMCAVLCLPTTTVRIHGMPATPNFFNHISQSWKDFGKSSALCCQTVQDYLKRPPAKRLPSKKALQHIFSWEKNSNFQFFDQLINSK